jgi:hypothetical protein
MRFSAKIAIAVIFVLLACFRTAATAKQETAADKKPMVLFAFDNDCTAWNSKITPHLDELENEYGTKVTFVRLDCSPAALLKSKARAEELGISQFMKDVQDYVPVVGVFNSQRKLIREFVAVRTKVDYKQAIEQALHTP